MLGSTLAPFCAPAGTVNCALNVEALPLMVTVPTEPVVLVAASLSPSASVVVNVACPYVNEQVRDRKSTSFDSNGFGIAILTVKANDLI